MLPVVVTGRRRPHEVMFLFVSVFLGAAFILGARPPATIEDELPLWMRWVWYIMLLAGGVTGLFGVFHPRVDRSLVYERTAMWAQTAAPGLYALAIVSYGQSAGLAAGVLLAGWSTASAWRLMQISRDIRLIRHAGEQ